MPITHAFTSTVADGADASLVKPSNWNAAHIEQSIGASVYNSADISVGNLTTVTLTFDSENWDSDTIHDTTTNTERMTCKTAGIYHIWCYIQWTSNNTNIRQMYVYKNGTDLVSWNQKLANYSTAMEINAIVSLAVNDYIDVKVRHNAGTTISVVNSSTFSPTLVMQKIG